MPVEQTHRVQQPQDTEAVGVARALRQPEAGMHVTLRGQVVDLMWSDVHQRVRQCCAVLQIALVQVQLLLDMGDVLEEPLTAVAPDNAVDLVALAQQQIGQIAAVLAGDSGD